MLIELADVIRESIFRSLEDRVGVSFSGGLDSSLIAFISKEKAEVELYSAGVRDSFDMLGAERGAEILKLPLFKVELNEEDIIKGYNSCARILNSRDFLKVEILVPVYFVCQKAKERGIHTLLFGAGTEELFVGYEKFYRALEEGKDLDKILRKAFSDLKKNEIAMIKKVCWSFGLEARFPFYSKEIADIVFSIPLEERTADPVLKKAVLREVAKILGLPDELRLRKKKAMQYGSGIHKVLLKNRDKLIL